MNAVSNLIAFSSVDPCKRDEVAAFQHLLVRLMSLLFQAALQELAEADDEKFITLGVDGIDELHLDHVDASPDASDVLLLWIQKLIVQCQYSGIVPIAPPILSRVFQELSNGIIDFQNTKQITDFPFPFPYAQMISVFLLLHYIGSPFLASLLISDPTAASLVTFVTVFSVWSANYIAAEIEMPFGTDPNDLPLGAMQLSFNLRLKSLMQPLSQYPPAFLYDKDFHPLFVERQGRRRNSNGASVRENPRATSWGCKTMRTESETLNHHERENDDLLETSLAPGSPCRLSVNVDKTKSNNSRASQPDGLPAVAKKSSATFSQERLGTPQPSTVVYAACDKKLLKQLLKQSLEQEALDDDATEQALETEQPRRLVTKRSYPTLAGIMPPPKPSNYSVDDTAGLPKLLASSDMVTSKRNYQQVSKSPELDVEPFADITPMRMPRDAERDGGVVIADVPPERSGSTGETPEYAMMRTIPTSSSEDFDFTTVAVTCTETHIEPAHIPKCSRVTFPEVFPKVPSPQFPR